MLLFITNNIKQLKRQWLSLPLLLLFPFILVGIIALLLFLTLTPSAKAPIIVGVVDENQSEETKLLTTLLTEAPVIAEHISMRVIMRVDYLIYSKKLHKKERFSCKIVVTITTFTERGISLEQQYHDFYADSKLSFRSRATRDFVGVKLYGNRTQMYGFYTHFIFNWRCDKRMEKFASRCGC